MLLRKFYYIFVCIYVHINYTSCEEGSSLAFAIDDTRSMWDDIDQVKSQATEIMKIVLNEKSSHIKNYVLVTINDPEVLLKTVTTSQEIFLDNLNRINTHNYLNSDCPEMSLTGVEKALLNSKPGSYIYVFTDATAKDYSKVDKIKSLCENTQSQVVFVLTGDCHNSYSRKFRVYHEIAEASGGQVFFVPKDQVHTVLNTIKIMVKGKHSILKSQVVPTSKNPVPIAFTIDEKAEYAVISTSGSRVQLRVTETDSYYGPKPQYERVMWNDNGKVLKINNLRPGTYYAWVKGSSSISVVIYVRTDFTFDHGFSVIKPVSMKNTSKQPLEGTRQYLSINVTDPEHSVDIKLVQLLDMDQNILKTMPLNKTGDNFYITDAFMSPTIMFKIAVHGFIKATRQPIERITKTAIEVIRTPNVTMSSFPEITIPETQTTFPYGSNAEITCYVESNPSPTIVWTDENGKVLQKQVNLNSEYKFINKLKLENLRKSAVFACTASNNIGTNTKYVNITVSSPFIVEQHINGNTNIYYGKQETLHCDIKSTQPIKIRWFKQNISLKSSRRIIIPDSRQVISEDGTQLKINFMDYDMDGKYICEATLLSDPKEKVSFTTNVLVDGLAIPEVSYSTAIINGTSLKAICRIKGVPKASISWQFKPKGSFVYNTIPGSEDELLKSELSLKDSGIYKCVAKNVLGSCESELNVVVEAPPVIVNDKKIFYALEGDSLLVIPCNVTGFPDPVVVWKKGGNVLRKDAKYDMQENFLHIINPDVKLDSGDITCEAKNKLGNADETFQIIVTDTFENDDDFYGITYLVNVDGSKSTILKIKCNLVDAKTRSVRWYRDGEITNQTSDTFIIERPTFSNDGNYTCRVNTDEGSKPETYVVNVGSSPVFQNEKISPESIDWHDDEVLDCLENSVPQAKIEWTLNGIKMESFTDKQYIHVTDWGDYTCKVSNLHGVIQRSFKVFTTGCYLTNHMASKNMPLLTQATTPSMPETITNSFVELKKTDKIKFSCPSSTQSANTFQMMPTKAEVIAECDTEDQFIVEGKRYKYKDLQCKSKVEPTVKETRELCSGPNTEILQVGFPVNGFMVAYKVCYDKTRNVPIYTSTPISMSEFGDGAISSMFVWSPTLGLNDNIHSRGFTCANSTKCCYEKRQLVNIDELPFGPTQVAAYKDNINSVAVWNSCEKSNRTSWQRLEQDIRSNSISYANWSSWTGTSNYMIKNGGLVPRYLWKVMKYDGVSSAMVYVNDESPVDSDVKCSQTCETMVNESTDKYLYCCTLDEFSTAFGIPIDKFRTSTIGDDFLIKTSDRIY